MHTYLISFSLPDQIEAQVPVLIEAYDAQHAIEQFYRQHPNARLLHCLEDD